LLILSLKVDELLWDWFGIVGTSLSRKAATYGLKMTGFDGIGKKGVIQNNIP
jgi:hypothetical protein